LKPVSFLNHFKVKVAMLYTTRANRAAAGEVVGCIRIVADFNTPTFRLKIDLF
jgi:hypothetical protein